MDTTPPLTPEQQQFIERVGLYFEQYHLSRIGGRLLGLLLLLDHPIGLGEMADLLGVSRASVSTNIRTAADFGLTELVTRPGDRRDYYQVGPEAWNKGIETRIEGARQLRRIAEQGLAATAQTGATAAHLRELLEFCDFTIAEQIASLERWRARHSERPPNDR
jgi:DNA-binding transcriptional regulator GbsR (MarR family)